ncbi:hypothetical protein N7481_009204 [Penicillium waksmanii]|uniref:uncharacterized protein n=1 Tax=Penicillium waksmanii TaxID=69791 RepID=UPI0025486A15|nr:uncharacterized protein N7481_009204 [Penicillium waksmanii]KAJ5975497.1 hypothetical protein N7481_009204 [Penicillium waksmanii]
MDFSIVDSGQIGQPKVTKVWMAYFRCDPLPVLDELQVEVIRWKGSKERKMLTLKYSEVKDMDGGEDAIAEFKPMS